MKTPSSRVAWAFLILLSVIKLGVVVQDFTQPISHALGGDADAWPNMAYFFYQNLTWFPYPTLHLISDQMLYPFGNNHVFQDLTLEFNYFYSFFYHFFGPYGPWTSFYYALSQLVGVTVAFWILRRDYPVITAFFITFLAFFFDFYAVFKFSGHLVHASHHWLSWSLITDLIIFHRIMKGRIPSFALILLKILIILGSLGQEVAYLAGFSLMSTSIFFFSAVVVVIATPKLRGKWGKWETFQSVFSIPKSAQARVGLLLVLIIIFIWAYIPLILQIIQNVNLYSDEPSPSGYTWAHPMKIFLPLIGRSDLVGLPLVMQALGDKPEFFWDYLIGWTLVGLLLFACVSMVVKKQFYLFLPLALSLGLCLLYHPNVSKTLHLFPWFQFNRNSGRSTLLFSTLIPLALAFLPIRVLSTKNFPWVAIWLLVGIAELISVYAIRWADKPYQFDTRFKAHMQTIQNTPGKVVLDYPFCLIGGNGVGYAENLCPCYIETNNQGFMAHYHRKSTVSYYYGRLYPSMIQPFVEKGWGNLMLARNKKEGQFNKLSDCPTDMIWQGLESIVKLGDFAGIQVYEDLLPSSTCLAMFFERFGPAVSSSRVPGGGLVHFIPKKESWRQLTDEEALKKLTFAP